MTVFHNIKKSSFLVRKKNAILSLFYKKIRFENRLIKTIFVYFQRPLLESTAYISDRKSLGTTSETDSRALNDRGRGALSG